MTNPKAMPKFRAKGNPFRSTTIAEPEAAQEPGRGRPVPAEEARTIAAGDEPSPPRSPMLPAAEPEPMTEQPVAAPAAASEKGVGSAASAKESAVGLPVVPAAKSAEKAPGWFAGLGARVRGWLPGARRQPAAPAVPRFAKGPVQAELSLDRVKVLRNDLSEADLEIVPAKPAPVANRKTEPGSAAAPMQRPAAGVAEQAQPEKAEGVDGAWERAGELFGAERAE